MDKKIWYNYKIQQYIAWFVKTHSDITADTTDYRVEKDKDGGAFSALEEALQINFATASTSFLIHLRNNSIDLPIFTLKEKGYKIVYKTKSASGKEEKHTIEGSGTPSLITTTTTLSNVTELNYRTDVNVNSTYRLTVQNQEYKIFEYVWANQRSSKALMNSSKQKLLIDNDEVPYTPFANFLEYSISNYSISQESGPLNVSGIIPSIDVGAEYGTKTPVGPVTTDRCKAGFIHNGIKELPTIPNNKIKSTGKNSYFDAAWNLYHYPLILIDNRAKGPHKLTVCRKNNQYYLKVEHKSYVRYIPYFPERGEYVSAMAQFGNLGKSVCLLDYVPQNYYDQFAENPIASLNKTEASLQDGQGSETIIWVDSMSCNDCGPGSGDFHSTIYPQSKLQFVYPAPKFLRANDYLSQNNSSKVLYPFDSTSKKNWNVEDLPDELALQESLFVKDKDAEVLFPKDGFFKHHTVDKKSNYLAYDSGSNKAAPAEPTTKTPAEIIYENNNHTKIFSETFDQCCGKSVKVKYNIYCDITTQVTMLYGRYKLKLVNNDLNLYKKYIEGWWGADSYKYFKEDTLSCNDIPKLSDIEVWGSSGFDYDTVEIDSVSSGESFNIKSPAKSDLIDRHKITTKDNRFAYLSMSNDTDYHVDDGDHEQVSDFNTGVLKTLDSPIQIKKTTVSGYGNEAISLQYNIVVSNLNYKIVQDKSASEWQSYVKKLWNNETINENIICNSSEWKIVAEALKAYPDNGNLKGANYTLPVLLMPSVNSKGVDIGHVDTGDAIIVLWTNSLSPADILTSAQYDAL